MDCLDVRGRVAAAVDRELPEAEWVDVEAHLATCGSCRQLFEAARDEDALLLRLFQPQRDAAMALAERVVRQLPDETPPFNPHGGGPSPRHAWSAWGPLLLAAAAGFLAALLIFPPWKRGTPEAPPVVQQLDEPERPAEADEVRLVVSTGELQVRADGENRWSSLDDMGWFACPSGTAMRTGENVSCELETSNGCVLRMNAKTEVAFREPNTIELRRGQILCSSPQDVAFKVLVADDTESGAANVAPAMAQKGQIWNADRSTSCVLTAVGDDGQIRVTNAIGTINVQTGGEVHQLGQGETATIEKGRLSQRSTGLDPLLAVGWIHPLLIRKGHQDAELAGRVDRLLARIGSSKVSLLYEQEIRSLGEYSVLPLLRYVQSAESHREPGRRVTAMRVLADVAPSWAIEELIGLLADPHPQVRVLAATGLQRLTGRAHGRAPARWSATQEECAPARAAWLEWWQKHGTSFPDPNSVPIEKNPATRKLKLSRKL